MFAPFYFRTYYILTSFYIFEAEKPHMQQTPNIYLVTERPEHFEAMGWTKFIDKYQAYAEIDPHDRIQFDLETGGLDSYLRTGINSHQIGIPGKQFVFDTHTVPLIECKDICQTKTLYGHNIGFDLIYCYKHGIIPTQVVDTMIVENLLTLGIFMPRGARGLDETLFRRCGVRIDKSAQKTIAQGLLSVEDITYAGTDVMPLFDLYEAQMERVRALQLEDRVRFECAYLPAHVYLEYSGIKVDPDKLERWVREIEADEMIILRKLEQEHAKINWASQQQVGEVLEQAFGEWAKNEETGKYITDDDALRKHKNADDPLIQDLLEHRGLAKLVSTYGRKWFHYILKDGRIHTRYKVMVETGRTACGDTQDTGNKYEASNTEYRCGKPFPNMQNLPRPKKDRDLNFRDIFTPKGGNVFVGCDYSSQEVVILADQSEDPAMMQLIENGDDLHAFVVRYAHPNLEDLEDEEIKEKYSDERTKCKEASFAIAFGGNWKTIMDNLNCTEEVAKNIFDSYMRAFPTLKSFFQHCFEFAWRKCYMPTDALTGGKRFFDRAVEYRAKRLQSTGKDKKYWERYWDEKAENTVWYQKEAGKMAWYTQLTSSLRKESVNTRIQGTAAVMSKLAMIYFFQWILENKMFGKVLIVAFVHDEIMVECHKKSAERVAAALQECMERAGDKCLKNLRIKAEPKISDKWEK